MIDQKSKIILRCIAALPSSSLMGCWCVYLVYPFVCLFVLFVYATGKHCFCKKRKQAKISPKKFQKFFPVFLFGFWSFGFWEFGFGFNGNSNECFSGVCLCLIKEKL